MGKRLPTLKTLLSDSKTNWQPVTIHGWYGGRSYDVQVVSQTAVWYHTGLPALPIRWVLVKDPKGKFEPQAFLCTDLCATPQQILEWFRSRWQIEVTFEEVRAHLGVETQRQWSDQAILRTTPALLAIFSVVVLLANQLQFHQDILLPHTAWYTKPLPTFIDALALVRQYLWRTRLLQLSSGAAQMVEVPQDLLECWSDLLCYAA